MASPSRTHLESFDVHTVEHLSVLIGTEVDHQVTVLLVGVDGVQEEERLRLVGQLRGSVRATVDHNKASLPAEHG